MAPSASAVILRPVSPADAAALAAGESPADVRVAPDHPTEFSRDLGLGASRSADRTLGPFFLHRATDDVVVGEIGGRFVDEGIVEIGYAVVASCQRRGHAACAVRAFVELARRIEGIRRLRGHTPVDRPHSARILERAGFTFVGGFDDQQAGQPIFVKRWELAL